MTEQKQNSNNGGLIPHSLEKEIRKSYIEYAMSVIVSRALPDTRDGFKPVLRRILYAMYQMKMFYNTKHKKSARIVWEVLWKYHPHGDSSVYEAMVRMAQPWSLRYPLVDWQGNFGSIDGDWPAAMRYTEARLTKIAEEMAADIDQDTVGWKDNFDWSLQEPIVLPTKFPNHLCNWTMWIAVGMATNMAPHNLTEIVDACILLLEKEWKPYSEQDVVYLQNLEQQKIDEIKEAYDPSSWEELVLPELQVYNVGEWSYSVSIDEIMEIIKWPDFPTGGIIFDPQNIKEVYKRWKWWIVMRGKVVLENTTSGQKIVITDIPYMVNKSNLVAKIWELVVNKKLEWITDIRDESSKNNIRVVITLRSGVNAEKILVHLYKSTELQSNFNVNNVSLIDSWSQPRLMNIKDLLVEFVEFRRHVVYRRSVYQLEKAKSRLHILEGLKKAIDIIDEVISTIRNSSTKQEAKDSLMQKFDFSDEQAEYILLMRLQSLVGLEIQRILEEIEEKKRQIEYLQDIISNPEKLDWVVKDELLKLREDFGDSRKTEISESWDIYNLKKALKDFGDAADRIKEDVIFWLNKDYSIKVLYQSRVLNVPEDTIDLIYTHNQDNLICISRDAELGVQRLKDFGRFQTQSEALNVKKHFDFKSKIIFAKTMHFHYDYLVILTNKNNIKKIKKDLVLSFKKFPTKIMGLEKDEKILNVLPVKENDILWILTKKWWMLLFDQKDIRPMWKTAWWVKAIELQDGDEVVNMFLYQGEPFIMIHSDKSGKLLNIEDLRIWKRTRKGQVVMTWDEKLEWWISIVEWAVTFTFFDWTVKTIHSNDIHLDEPETPLRKIVDKKIDMVYRPWEEKDENTMYKDKLKEEQTQIWLFSEENENDDIEQ